MTYIIRGLMIRSLQPNVSVIQIFRLRHLQGQDRGGQSEQVCMGGIQ